MNQKVKPADQEVAVRRYLEGESYQSLAAAYGVSDVQVMNWCKARGVQSRPSHLIKRSEQSVTEAAVRYKAGEKVSVIASDLGVRPGTVYEWVRLAGETVRTAGETRRCELDHEAFSVLTEESAYWIGFLMADGCITSQYGKAAISLGLSSKDHDHVEKFRSFLKTTRAISSRAPSTVSINGRRTQNRGCSYINVLSEQIASDLAVYGVVPRKTHTASPPPLPEGVRRHFWRGMVDGDGHVIWSDKRQTAYVGISGTLAICEGFRDWAESVTGHRGSIAQKRGCWLVNLHGRIVTGKAAWALYHDASVFLTRKAETARKIALPLDSARRERKCSQEGCDRRHYGHGLCSLHYQRKHYTPGGQARDRSILEAGGSFPQCKLFGCDRRRTRDGYCRLHSYRARRGLPLDAPVRNCQPR